MKSETLIFNQFETTLLKTTLFLSFLLFLLSDPQSAFSQNQVQLFWSADGEVAPEASTVGKTGIDGSNPQNLFSGIRSWGMAADYNRGQIFWTDHQKGTVERANMDGSGRQVIANGQSGPAGIAFDPIHEKIYWVNYDEGAVYRANADGSGKQNVTPQATYVGLFTIALDATRGKMYISDYHSGRIDKANLDGTQVEYFYSNPPDYITGITLDEETEWVYWADRWNGTIKRKATDGGGMVETVVSGQAENFGFGLLTYRHKLYWSNISEHSIKQSNLDGSGQQVIASSLPAISGLAVAAPGRHFAGAQTLQVPNNLLNIVIKDITGDTYPDIVGNSANLQDLSQEFYILPGSSQGSFSAAITKPTTAGYRVQDIGDANKDNIPDLLSHYYWDNGMRLFNGTGNNNFSEGTAYPTGTHARVSRLTDIDKDGHADMVHMSTGSGQPNVLHIYKGQANGTFAAKQSYTSQSVSAMDMEILDINGDTRPDVVAKMEGVEIACIFLQQADGSFVAGNAITTSAAESSVTFGDMDGDGVPDKVVADYKSGVVIVYTGHGNGNFSEQPMKWVYVSGAFRPQVKDINGDRLNDLLVGQTSDGAYIQGLVLFMGTGYGAVHPADILKISPAFSFSITDVNKDNRPDMVIAHTNKTVSVYINQRTGASIEVTPDILPHALLGKEFDQRLGGSGGQDPYQYTLSGNLPAGISFERGIFSGVPTTAGSTTFTVVMTDEIGNTASKEYTLHVTKESTAIAISNTEHAYDGTAKWVTVTTTPAGLSTVVTYNGSTTMPIGAGTYSVVVTVVSPTHEGSATATMIIYKTSQDISFDPLEDKTYGDPAFTLTATSSSGLPVTYVSENPAVATISGNVVTITGAGSVIITASQAGNNNYEPAEHSQSLNVFQAPQTITFPSIADKVLGSAPFSLTAAASSGLPVTFTVVSGPATISGNMLGLSGAGTVTVRALQAGNSNYEPAVSVERSFTVYAANAQPSFVTNPANGSTTTSTNLYLSTVPGATAYTVQVSTSADFSTGAVTKTTSARMSTGTYYASFPELQLGQLYYVRVKTNLSDTWGRITSFSTKAAHEYSFVTNPANGGVLTSTALYLNTVPGASAYTVEVNTAPDFTGSSIIKTTSARFSTGTYYASFPELSLGQLYYVRVKTNLSGTWGRITTFSTATAERFAYVINPANGGTITGTTLYLNKVPGVASYTVQVSTGPDFTGSSITKTTSARMSTGTYYASFPELQLGQLYYVRVKTNLSDTWGRTTSFSTKAAGLTAAKIDYSSDQEGIMISDVKLYPNPFAEQIYIEVNAPETSAVSLAILDVQGRVCFRSEQYFTNGPITLGKDLKAGVYLLQVSYGQTKSTYRIIKL